MKDKGNRHGAVGKSSSEVNKKPASQRTSSVGEDSLGQQPTRYANITIDTKWWTKFYSLVYGKGSCAKY